MRRESLDLPIPGCKPRRGLDLEVQHYGHHQEGTAETLLPVETPESTSPKGSAGVVLPLLGREHPHLLHQCVVPELYRRGEESSPEGRQYSTENYWLPPPPPEGTVWDAMSQKGDEDLQRSASPRESPAKANALGQTVQADIDENKQTQEKLLPKSDRRAKQEIETLVNHITYNLLD